MNKLKYFLFMCIIFLAPNVFAIDVSNKVEAIPDFGGGTYYGQTPTSPTAIVYNNIGTRYQGKLSVISFYLNSDDWNWSYSKTYTIELYMETNDWDNNFMYPQVYRANTNGDTLGSNLAKSSVTFVSNKKIKFTFKTPDDVMNTYLKFRIYSTNYNSVGITRITNYNFNKVIITENQTSGGSSGGSGTTPTPTPTPTNSTDAIIDSNIQNTEDIINNNNQNTQDIIENANNNFNQATETITGSLDELLGKKCSNLFDFPYTNDNPYTFTATTDDFIRKTGVSIDLEANKTYKYSFKSDKDYNRTPGVSGVEIYFLKDNAYNTIFTPTGKSGQFTPSQSGTYYLRLDCNKNGDTCSFYDFMISLDTNTFCPFGSYSSQIDETNKEIKELNDKLDGLSAVINSEQVPTIDVDIGEAGDTPIIDLIYMPLTFIEKILDISDNTCSSYTIPFDFSGGNNTLTLPCINLKNILGNDFYNILNAIISFYMVYNIGLMCVTIYNNITSLKDSFTILYESQRDDYIGHGRSDE